jgi:hypothetical protein
VTSRAADALDVLGGEPPPAAAPEADAAPVRNVGGRPRKDGTPAQPTNAPGYVSPRAKKTDNRTNAQKNAARDARRTSGGDAAPRPRVVPAARDEAADEAAKDVRRAFFAANAVQIKKSLGDFYGMPFEIAAAASDVRAIELDPAKKAERAETLYWVLTVYCPDWTKHLPLLVLGGCVVADAGAAFAAYKAAKSVRPAKARETIVPPAVEVKTETTPQAAEPAASS